MFIVVNKIDYIFYTIIKIQINSRTVIMSISSNTIKVWNLGKVRIYPHLEIDELWDYAKIQTEFSEMQQKLTQLSFINYGCNNYCSEINGRWNIPFGVIIYTDEGVIHYTYMIRRDHQLKKTFCCPFYHEDYGYNRIPNKMFDRKSCPNEFEIIEKYLMEKFNGNIIDSFQC